MGAGKVWLVGAGPGDVGLFTLKGKEVLERADVVVYDRLVGSGILAMIPKSARCIDVGKRAGDHTMPQWQINETLVQEARSGNRVVRLKGGDPFLFGRGGEELERLKQAGVPYEVVCGITSAIAVPAYQGIPVTHRDCCSSVHIIAGHQKDGSGEEIDFDALVRTKGTLVFLMGVGMLPELMKKLTENGMNSDMPAAVLQKGTTARQKRIVATVSTLADEVSRRGVETPAIIVVGAVCGMAEKLSWYENLPLAGMRLAVTRPADSAATLTAKLREKGAEVIEFPTIRTELLEDRGRLERALHCLGNYQWLVFTSPAGVRSFFAVMRENRLDARVLAGVKLAAVGPGTARELEKFGLLTDLQPGTYDGASLGRELAEQCSGGERILIPRAAKGGQPLIEALKAGNGLQIEDIPIYETVYEQPGVTGLAGELEKGDLDGVVFTSASAVKGFAAAFPEMDFGQVTALCIGKQTAAEAGRLGMKLRVAEEATLDSLVKLAETVASERRELAEQTVFR